MLTHLVPIGNSRGIRIPKSFLKQCNIKNDVQINIKDSSIIIQPSNNIRSNWDAELKYALQASTAKEEVHYIESDFDKEEWQW